MDPIALLNKNKLEILHELVAGHRDPQRARALVEQLTRTESALTSMQPAQGKYVGVKKVRDAIKDVIETSGRPWTEEELKEEIVIKGGWRRGGSGVEGANLSVKRALTLHLAGRDGYKTWPLKKVNDRYGPESWSNKLFASEKPQR